LIETKQHLFNLPYIFTLKKNYQFIKQIVLGREKVACSMPASSANDGLKAAAKQSNRSPDERYFSTEHQSNIN
jgi:hypothetical protein